MFTVLALSLPLYSERNPFDDSAPQAASAGDIILKAQAFGMKVWRHDSAYSASHFFPTQNPKH